MILSFGKKKEAKQKADRRKALLKKGISGEQADCSQEELLAGFLSSVGMTPKEFEELNQAIHADERNSVAQPDLKLVPESEI